MAAYHERGEGGEDTVDSDITSKQLVVDALYGELLFVL